MAVNISWNNKTLDEDEINFAVQQTIDRIIFLRIAEDRSVEPYGNLKHAINQGNLYLNLFEQFRKADEKYNSGLFDLKKDRISETLRIENKIIRTIINELYFPECPYEFSVLPVEILGSAYEQFLGKVIRITPAHHAKIEEKPEVRKAGGVYYTPQYIVEYIVKNTVGKLIERKTPKEISNIKIVDPACGSGSFLIGAFQYLLDYHKNYYSENGKISKGKKDNPLTPDGHLTTAEKKRILLNNIYGVDIDVNAVEVTKLSLLLKCMEGETEASINQQLRLFNERVLPILEENIKSGNSLIDMDFYDTQLDFGEEKKIKPFSWQKGFPNVFRQGGFDSVIGNPPYVMLQNHETREIFEYALHKYKCAKYKIDTYQLFIEGSLNLLKTKGLLGFITPNTFLKNIHSEPLRRLLLDNTKLNEFVIFNYPVFSAASVDTCIIIAEKEKPQTKSQVTIKEVNLPFEPVLKAEILQFSFHNSPRADFNISISDQDSLILQKLIEKSEPLGTFCRAYFGIQTHDRSKYVSKSKINNCYLPVIDGVNINTYLLLSSNEYVFFTPEAIKSGGDEAVYKQERICIRQIGSVPIATMVPANIFTLNTIYNVYLIKPNSEQLKFILGIINSKATSYFWQKINSDEKRTFPKIKKEAILSIRIPKIVSNEEQVIQNDVIKLVEQILKLKGEIITTSLMTKIDIMKLKINFCETRINEIVYQLYGLSEEEIRIIENA